MEKVPLTGLLESRVATSQKSLQALQDDATAIPQMGFTAIEPSRFQATTNISTSSNVGNTLYFRDGIRRIDYVLAYTELSNKVTAAKRARRRAEFENQLRKMGIDFEHDAPVSSGDGTKTGFVKLHGTWNFLENQAEALKIRMPLKISDVKIRSRLEGALERIFKYNPFKLSEKIIREDPQYFTAVYDRRYTDQFLMKNKETFFSCVQRSRMIWDALLRTEFGEDGSFGIKRLLTNGTYDSAYPLHEEFYRKGEKPATPSERHVLYENWAHPSRFYKYQPLNLIRKYFGEKITIYFAWLGFYTEALLPAALAGIICIVFGWASLADDAPSSDICDEKGVGGSSMCPNGPLDRGNIWQLSASCLFSKVTYIFDNTATVVFAVFMSIWATMFLEGWKRRQAELAWDWDMHNSDMDEEAVRPEYISGVKTLKRNPITGEEEPHLPFSSKVLRLIGSGVAVLFFLSLVLAFVFGVIVYRTIVIKLFERHAKVPNARAIVLTSVTAAGLNLIIIMVLDIGYQYLAWFLTNWEFPRTDQEFEDSYTFKVFLFQFINYYSSLFYIAFFKGRFVSVADNKGIGGYGEACDPAGCMVELLIQLSIIMVGKQFFNNLMEIFIPILLNRWRRWRRKSVETISGNTRWEKDWHLNELPPLAMFGEYMEMVIQYGFITLFVAAFPLAPFFAMINNIMEIRLDAFKFLGTYRRPMPARARDLGVWYKILDVISHLAVITNACVIAFTSDFVPRMFYKYTRSADSSLAGYVNYTLAFYDTRPRCEEIGNVSTEFNSCSEPFCRYKDHRLVPCTLNNLTGLAFGECDLDKTYKHSVDWWHIMVARLAFVLIFEHVVFLFKGVMAYIIPDTPHYIFIQIQREQYLAKQALYNRAYVVAGTTDTEGTAGGSGSSADGETGQAAANGTPLTGKKAALGAKGSTPSLSRAEFRYSPVDSMDSSDDEKVKKNTKKLPVRRL